MSTIIVEQRLPVLMQVISRVPTYAHFVASVVAIIIFWVRPSLTPKMPASAVVRQTLKPRVVRTRSLKSTSTLVDFTSDKPGDSKNVEEESVGAPINLHNPFSKFTSPVKLAMAPTLTKVRPYTRRMSLPARRFTEHFASAISTPFHHHHHQRRSLDAEANSYFVSQDLPMVMTEAKVEVEIEVVEVGRDVLDSEVVTAASPKPTRFKRIARKAKAILRIRRRL